MNTKKVFKSLFEKENKISSKNPLYPSGGGLALCFAERFSKGGFFPNINEFLVNIIRRSL